ISALAAIFCALRPVTRRPYTNRALNIGFSSMRINHPVTGREVILSNEDEIVSSSNLRGDIAFCNDTFCRISGFELQELIGQPHNIIRRPYMPPVVFAQMWQRLKSGRAWMGVVKNRCKNGD